ncbi:LON-related ATP-dependent protease [Rhizoctonia solani]|uniref:Lon protease homolog n=1 Tax=Rhizoctonia solani TaxID=456999 RepID=A0A8H8NRM2_9AGAM|nr:LON-related ATP-dependent protease [Rhizoctonia solani]QRW18250.1 LON-related ATP-dependent protease [Rhizoctonia solani]
MSSSNDDSHQTPPASSSSGTSGSDDGSDNSSGSSPPGSHSSSSSDPPSPTSALTKQTVPEVYPQVLALPITRRPLFPGFYKAVVVRNPAVVSAIKEMMKRGQPYLGAFLLKDENADSDIITDIDSVHQVGVFAQITSVFPASKGDTAGKDEGQEESLTAVLYPHRRIRITDLITPAAESVSTATIEEVPPETTELAEPEAQKLSGTVQTSFLHNYAVSLANVENLAVQPYSKSNQYIRAVMSEIVSVFKDIAQLNPLFRDQITNFTISQSANNVFDEPDKLADFAAAVSTGEVNELQDVLESLIVEERLQKALLVLKKELINAQLQSKISRDVESKIQKRQREYYLMEQLKGIKKELGMESDGKDKLIEKFRERANSLKMPEGVRKVFEEELNKLQHLEPAASEANVTRNYLDWLTQVYPMGPTLQGKYSIAHATKETSWDGGRQNHLLCWPSWCRQDIHWEEHCPALNRQFFRFSVGGLTDVAEIKGHRRTYVGTPEQDYPGSKAGWTENPLILIDEVDKIGRGHNGDPASALLECSTRSKIRHFWIITWTSLSTCPASSLFVLPTTWTRFLLHYSTVWRFSKSADMSRRKRLKSQSDTWPQAKEASGLKEANVTLDPSAIDHLIKYYCRESGVRNLKKHIDKIYRKAAFKIVTDLGEEVFPEETTTSDKPKDGQPEKTVESTEPAPNAPTAKTESGQTTVTTEERKPLKIYQKDRFYTHAPPAGVSTGLGYLGNGSGAVMPVEATTMPGKGGLQLTGKLGEVIRESAQLALSWVKSHAHELGITNTPEEQTLHDRDVHLHMPEGSIGKEGPSAGTAIATAFVSLLTKTKVNPDIAMTGELSLVGQVLPVGGLKEKILAAHRAGIKTILAPSANRPDIEENVPESVKTGIRFVFVDDIRQVLHEVFKGEPIAERWKETLPQLTEPVTSEGAQKSLSS